MLYVHEMDLIHYYYNTSSYLQAVLSYTRLGSSLVFPPFFLNLTTTWRQEVVVPTLLFDRR
jgi:hypothetical protein